MLLLNGLLEFLQGQYVVSWKSRLRLRQVQVSVVCSQTCTAWTASCSSSLKSGNGHCDLDVRLRGRQYVSVVSIGWGEIELFAASLEITAANIFVLLSRAHHARLCERWFNSGEFQAIMNTEGEWASERSRVYTSQDCQYFKLGYYLSVYVGFSYFFLSFHCFQYLRPSLLKQTLLYWWHRRTFCGEHQADLRQHNSSELEYSLSSGRREWYFVFRHVTFPSVLLESQSRS